jgi:anaerobic magnesium-protoporphyrin IX monomethyl ester cyclase
MEQLKIAFYVSRYSGEEIQTPPSLQYLSGYLIAHNLLKEDNCIFADSIEDILSFEPDILCIGSVSQVFFDAKNIAKLTKSKFPECFIIVGGYHISSLPNELSEEFDIGVIGEGEITLSELVLLYLKKQHKDIDRLANINGICFKNKNKLIRTQSRALIKNIDEQPRPFRRPKKNQQSMYLFSARGCPYQCTFCASQSFWDKYRAHSAKYVVEEIEKIYKDYGIKHIYFVDDLFIAPKKRLVEMYNILKEKNLIGTLSFEGFVRINIIDEEVIQILKEMKFKEIRFGLETASPRLMKLIKHQPPKMEKIYETIELCKKYNLKLCGSLMFGIPGETKEDLEITVKFLKDNINDFHINGFYLMQPVPGTQIWNDMIEQNILTDTNFDVASMEIALYKKDFNWNNALYLNEKNIPLEEFKEIIAPIRDEFLYNTNLQCNNDGVINSINNESKVLIYGTGTIAQKLYDDIKHLDIFICSGDINESGKLFHNLKIAYINDIKLDEFQYIFITAQRSSIDIYETAIKNTLSTNTIVFIPYYKYIDNIRACNWRIINNS